MDAMLCRIALHTGDLDEADVWYRVKAPREPMHINILKRYQYFTQAMVELANGKPDSALFDQASEFKPEKVVCAAGGRIYVQAAGVNRGLIEFSAEGEFQGYMGASPVRFDWTDYIWKILSTDAQKRQMESFVPTEYNNIAVDSEGFLFVTNSVFSQQDLLSGAAQPVRRLNLKGSNILNCDLQGMENWNDNGPSRFIDVTVPESKIIYLLDSRYCRIFAYDSMGNMLYAFGGYGNRVGWFQNPTALESWGSAGARQHERLSDRADAHALWLSGHAGHRLLRFRPL